MSDNPLLIVYDGDCPFCSAYVRMLRIRSSAGPTELVNARDGHPVVKELVENGFDLDEGMALVRGFGTPNFDVAHGDDCVHQLALMSSPVGIFNRLNARILGSRRASKLLYPVLRSGRNTALLLMGRKRLNKSQLASYQNS